LVTSVRGSGFAPTTAASVADGVISFMKAAFGLRAAAGFFAAAVAFGAAALAGAAAFFAAGFAAAAGLAAAFFAGAAVVFLAVAIFEPPKRNTWKFARERTRLILVGI
jgi:hypothetical protein